MVTALVFARGSSVGYSEHLANHDRIAANLASQTAPQTTPDEAKPFLGEWTSILDGPTQQITLAIAIKIDDGKVRGTVASDLFAETNVDEITSGDKGISLRFRRDLWGYSGAMLLKLVPDGDHLQVELTIMNGQFTTSGIARKKSSGGSIRS